MARDDLYFRLRIPEDLKLKVEESAKRNNRSMTGEMIAILEDFFDAPSKISNEIDALMRFAQANGPHINTLWTAVAELERRLDDIDEKVGIRASSRSHLLRGDFSHSADAFSKEFPEIACHRSPAAEQPQTELKITPNTRSTKAKGD